MRSDGHYRSGVNAPPVELVEGPPPTGIKMPRDRYKVLSEKVIDRLLEHVSDVTTSVNKLDQGELIQWSSSDKREELLRDIDRLYRMVKGE